MNLVAAFTVGALTSLAMAVASLRFYVSMERPYLAYLASFIVVALILAVIRNAWGKQVSFTAAVVATIGEAACFALGCVLVFYALMLIYPPNIS